MKKVKNILVFASLLLATAEPCQAQFSGLIKWFNTEVKPTVKGERPLNIDPTRVRISHNGKDILRASSEGQGSVYVDFGVAKVQTSDLKTRIAQTGAIFSGNTAVMTQVAFEQFKKFNEKALKEEQERNNLTVSNTPPNIPVVNEPGTGRTVIVYNHTLSPINYAMNVNPRPTASCLIFSV
jgi:hypothetical protein